MLEKGLAYKQESYVNWCPKRATVLANKQAQEEERLRQFED